jgi:hypothetical protein
MLDQYELVKRSPLFRQQIKNRAFLFEKDLLWLEQELTGESDAVLSGQFQYAYDFFDKLVDASFELENRSEEQQLLFNEELEALLVKHDLSSINPAENPLITLNHGKV